MNTQLALLFTAISVALLALGLVRLTRWVGVKFKGFGEQVSGLIIQLGKAFQGELAHISARIDALEYESAKAKGYDGRKCMECFNRTLVRNGDVVKCTTCGGSSDDGDDGDVL